jgi:hypothetical protein
LVLAGALASCVKLDVDEEPPYPKREGDYTHSDRETPPPPWTNPQDYPYATIAEPTNGAFVEPGEVEVRGTYAGPELASLTLNGQPLAIGGSTFSGTVTVSPDDVAVEIKVTATTKEDGLVSSDLATIFVGEATPIAGTVENGWSIDLENRGLKAVGATLAKLLDGLDLSGLIQPPSGITIEELSIEGVSLLPSSTTDGLRLRASVATLNASVTALGLPITLALEGVTADLTINLTVDDQGQITASIVDVQLSIASLGLDGLLDPIASYLVSSVLELVVKLLVPGLLNDALDGLQVLITGNGYTLTLLPGATVFTDRNFALALDAQLAVTDESLWKEGFQPDGFRTTPSAPAMFPATTPKTEKPYGLALGFNDDALNQILYALAATGTLDFDLTDELLRAEVFSIVFFSFDSLPEDMPLVIRLSPSTAPLVWGDAETQTAYLQLPAYTLQVLADRGADGLWEAMSLAIDVSAPLTLQFNDDGSFSLLLGELGLGVQVVHNPVGQKNIANIERLFAELLGDLLPSLLADLGDALTISLPELAGLDITVVDMATFGDQNDNLGIFVDLQ